MHYDILYALYTPMTLKEKKGTDGHMNEHRNLVTTSLLELLIAARNISAITDPILTKLTR